METVNKNQLVWLVALIVMMIVSASAGYRLQLSMTGLIFERNAPTPFSAPPHPL